MTGVGVKPSSRWITVGTSLAASTSSAVRCRPRQRVRVLAHVERTGDGLRFPVLADRLGDRQDVRLIERAAQGCSAVPAGPEADLLGGIVRIRPALEIVPFQPREINQHRLWGRLAGQW